METTTLTSKGQLVIPKRIRDALRASPGTRFSVTVRGSGILLELLRPKSGKLSDWPGRNPRSKRLSDAELCKPVTLGPRD